MTYGLADGDCFFALFEERCYFLDNLAELGRWEGRRRHCRCGGASLLGIWGNRIGQKLKTAVCGCPGEGCKRLHE